MQYKIEGELAQTVHMKFNKGEQCWASKGSLMSYDPKLDWRLKIPGGAGGAARRVMAGEGVTLTYLEADQDGLEARLTANQPGKIMDWDLSDGPIVTTRGSFVAAFGAQVDITVIVTRRAGAAFFGGAGLFLQKISGQGRVLVHGSGDFVSETLTAGQSRLVSTGNLAAFSETVDYDIQSVGGCRRMFFGGEGIFMTKLTGPGRILLQTLKRVPVQASSSG